MDDGFEQGLGSASIGERLRLAREERGMALEDVANQTRIPIRHLQHIEQEQWDALPGVTYCVGFARAYANIIGLDGAEIGRELRDRLGGTMTRAPAPQYYEPADPSRVPPRSLALIAGIIAVVGIVLYLLWRSSLGDGEESAPVAAATPEATAPAAPAPAAQPAAQPAAVAGQAVTLTATQEVWLRISDSSGGPALFSGIMAAGQTFQVPATAQNPVIRTGRPQVLRVTIGTRDIGPLEPVERTIDDVSLRPEALVARQQAAAAQPPAPNPAPAAQPTQ
jgi:cytoskeleton protein RodZ